MDIYEFLEYQLRPLSRHSRHVLDAWLEKFVQQKVLKLIGAPAKNLVAQHRSAGDICVIITATNNKADTRVMQAPVQWVSVQPPA